MRAVVVVTCLLGSSITCVPNFHFTEIVPLPAAVVCTAT